MHLEPAEEQFIQKALKIVEENIASSDFGVDELCTEMSISRPQFYRKIHAIAGVSVNEFIKDIRLKRAAQLLKQHPERISEIAFIVGFNDPKYFSKCFKKQFGVSPAQYIIESERFLPPQ
jgi:AraC-like DNA-binding protein